MKTDEAPREPTVVVKKVSVQEALQELAHAVGGHQNALNQIRKGSDLSDAEDQAVSQDLLESAGHIRRAMELLGHDFVD